MIERQDASEITTVVLSKGALHYQYFMYVFTSPYVFSAIQ